MEWQAHTCDILSQSSTKSRHQVAMKHTKFICSGVITCSSCLRSLVWKSQFNTNCTINQLISWSKQSEHQNLCSWLFVFYSFWLVDIPFIMPTNCTYFACMLIGGGIPTHTGPLHILLANKWLALNFWAGSQSTEKFIIPYLTHQT
jgi:hypothetical protein